MSIVRSPVVAVSGHVTTSHAEIASTLNDQSFAGDSTPSGSLTSSGS